MSEEIVIPYVRGKLADDCKRFDADIVARMVIEYDRVCEARDNSDMAIVRLQAERADLARAATGAVESVAEWEREYNDMQKRATTAEAEVERLHNKINDLSKVSQDYEDTLRAARNIAEAEADQYKMQLSTALNECLDTVYRENSLVVALNKKDAENERLRAALEKIAAIGRVEDGEYNSVWEVLPAIKTIARAALDVKP